MCSVNGNDDIGFYFKKINDYIIINANNRLNNRGITFSQMHILSYLIKRKEEAVPQKDIETRFGLQHSTVIGLLKRMEKKDLLRVEVNPSDRRSRRVVLLKKAYDIDVEMKDYKNSVEKMLTKGLTDEQVSALKNLLRVVYDKNCKNNEKQQ